MSEDQNVNDSGQIPKDEQVLSSSFGWRRASRIEADQRSREVGRSVYSLCRLPRAGRRSAAHEQPAVRRVQWHREDRDPPRPKPPPRGRGRSCPGSATRSDGRLQTGEAMPRMRRLGEYRPPPGTRASGAAGRD